METTIRFFTLLMRSHNLHVHRFSIDCIPELDLGLRKALNIKLPDLPSQLQAIEERTIYMFETRFLWRYLSLRLPECDQYLLVGPYLSEHADDQAIMSIMEEQQLPPSRFALVRRFFHSIPIVPSENMLFTSVNALGDMLWGKDGYRTERLVQGDIGSIFSADSNAPMEETLEMELIEERYESESQLLYAIEHGQIHKASAILAAFHPKHVEQRSTNPLRNTKNYAIISNTLMRKAVQQGGVHPYYIDRLSSSIAQRIEQAMTVEETQQLLLTMAHKYCLLVKNHNMTAYSLPVQHVILRTDADITGDLSLRAHAARLNINASYLSALFKKETGMTLTDYVNHKRIDFAIYLLNSTSMQIQTIAQHCGMPDVNYFTRMFKRIIGITPSQYRRHTRGE